MDAVSCEVEAGLGCPLSRAADMLTLAADLGLHCVGVGFNLSGALATRVALVDRAVEIAAHLLHIGRSLGLPLRVLSVGGGFPPLSAAHSASFGAVAARLNAALDYHLPAETFGELDVIATPGRFFAAAAFSLVTSIVQKTEVDASTITNDDFDAGQRGFVYEIAEGYYGAFGCRAVANCNPRCAPLFGDELVDAKALAAAAADTSEFYGSVVGPDEDAAGFDTVLPQCRFREMHAGEWMHWANIGAYSLSNYTPLGGDDDGEAPFVYYFANESDWKTISRDMSSERAYAHGDDDAWTALDDERSIGGSEDSAINSAEETDDCDWLFNIATE